MNNTLNYLLFTTLACSTFYTKDWQIIVHTGRTFIMKNTFILPCLKQLIPNYQILGLPSVIYTYFYWLKCVIPWSKNKSDTVISVNYKNDKYWLNSIKTKSLIFERVRSFLYYTVHTDLNQCPRKSKVKITLWIWYEF